VGVLVGTMQKIIAAAIVTATSANDLKLAWEDCGDASTHTKITDFTPFILSLGAKTTMAGTGAIDEDVADGATFDLEMTSILGKLLSCKGDASVTKTCHLPLNVGSLTYDAMPFPIKKGLTTVKVDIQLSSALPAALASTTTIATAASKSGDKLFCMKIMSSKAGQDAQQNRETLGAKGQSVRPEKCVPSGTICTRSPECKDINCCCSDCCWPGQTHFVPLGRHGLQMEVCGMWADAAETANAVLV
jgi:hypothetical protein